MDENELRELSERANMLAHYVGNYDRPNDQMLAVAELPGVVNELVAYCLPLLNELAAERVKVERLRAELLTRAERQEHYALPLYTQHTDEERTAFLHAAKMLRLAAAALEETKS